MKCKAALVALLLFLGSVFCPASRAEESTQSVQISTAPVIVIKGHRKDAIKKDATGKRVRRARRGERMALEAKKRRDTSSNGNRVDSDKRSNGSGKKHIKPGRGNDE